MLERVVGYSASIMDSYDDCAALVLVSGIDGPSDLKECVTSEKEIEFTSRNIHNSKLQTEISSELLKLARPTNVNQLGASNKFFNMQFSNSVMVPEKVYPSKLSPRNPDCTDPVFSLSWIDKYLYTMPTTALVFYDQASNETEEIVITQKIMHLKSRLGRLNCKLIVVLVGSESESSVSVLSLKRKAGLTGRDDIFVLDENVANLHGFLESLMAIIYDHTTAYFDAKMNKIREKRKALMPPYDVMLWDIRFTLKLAFCAEFKKDERCSIKLFESAYDSLTLVFVKGAINTDSEEYYNGRQLLDLIAFKLVRKLVGQKAYSMFRLHIRTVHHIYELNSISLNSKCALKWSANQFASFAQLCTLIESNQVSSSSSLYSKAVPHVPAGLLWLEVAQFLSKLGDSDQIEESLDDGFSEDEKDSVDIRNAFLNSISGLSLLPRSKAFALVRYGEWLERTEPDAATEAYKSAQRLLGSNAWPNIESFLSKKLNDKLNLFLLNLSDELPNLKHESNTQIFKVSAAFQYQSTFIGREIKAQVTLFPQFDANLSLEWIKITDSIGSYNFTHLESKEEGDDAKLLVRDRECSLYIKKRQPITLEYSINPLEIGEITFVNVEFQTKGGFKQIIPIEESSKYWLKDNAINSRTKKHFAPSEDPLFVSVKSRPARIDIIDETVTVAAVDERMKFDFKLISHEEQDIEPQYVVYMDDDVIMKDSLKLSADGTPSFISGYIDVSNSGFELKFTLTFDTASDSIPVSLEYNKDIDVIIPFRANFSLKPEYFPQEWPAFFAQVTDIPDILRKWCLHSTILSLLTNVSTYVYDCKLVLENSNNIFELEQDDVAINEPIDHNAITTAKHKFTTKLNISSENSFTEKKLIDNVEARAHLELTWKRQGHETLNKYIFPSVRLNLPSVEPRILAVPTVTDSEIKVSYHIENLTPKILNFSITMASSAYFAFQGPKIMSLRMLPFSSYALNYQLITLGDGRIQNKRPLPELRVFDKTSKRTLVPIAGSPGIVVDQGSLFIII